jgi:hypothetical protein
VAVLHFSYFLGYNAIICITNSKKPSKVAWDLLIVRSKGNFSIYLSWLLCVIYFYWTSHATKLSLLVILSGLCLSHQIYLPSFSTLLCVAKVVLICYTTWLSCPLASKTSLWWGCFLSLSTVITSTEWFPFITGLPKFWQWLLYLVTSGSSLTTFHYC